MSQAATDDFYDIRVFDDAVGPWLFERLVSAVRSVGDERLDVSYDTTFWFPRGLTARNIAEAAIERLIGLALPPAEWIGAEWWLGRLTAGQRLPFHFDRDLSLSRSTGEYVPPIYASILYLTSVPSSPTVILGQIAGPDGKTRIPRRSKFRRPIDAVANRYVVFCGRLRHGVAATAPGADDAGRPRTGAPPAEDRLSLLVNYWHRRPRAPICRDYDGSIYASLRHNAPSAALPAS